MDTGGAIGPARFHPTYRQPGQGLQTFVVDFALAAAGALVLRVFVRFEEPEASLGLARNV
jgi:hypothetical protein